MNDWIPLQEEEVIELKDGILLGNDRVPLTKCQSCLKKETFFTNLVKFMGTKFMFFLFFSQAICKGMLMSLIGSAMLPIFKNKMGASASETEIYTVLCLLPWSIKPIIGLCSDFIILGGYNKRGWLIIGNLIGIGSLVLLFVTVFINSSLVSPFLLVSCFIGVNFEVAMFDLLSEAKYSEVRNNHPELGSSPSVYANGLITFGSLLALTFVGKLSDDELYWVIFLLALVCGCAPLLPTLLGWLPEVKYVNAKWIQLVEKDRIRRELPMILVVAFAGVSGIITSVVTTLATPFIGLLVSGLLLFLCLAGCWRYFPEEITQVALYQVITTLSAPSIGSALSYFFTASETCLPNGPHFSFAYFTSWAGIVGQVLGLFSVFIYAAFLSKLRFRKVLIITTILQGLGGLSDLIIVLRLNIYIGLSDKAAYIIGGAVLEPVVDMLNWLPANALLSIFNEKGMEASCFALLAGTANFAKMVTKLNGSIIFSMAGIQTSANAPCNFDALWWLILVCHVLAPIIIGIPATFLIPDMEQTGERRRRD